MTIENNETHFQWESRVRERETDRRHSPNISARVDNRSLGLSLCLQWSAVTSSCLLFFQVVFLSSSGVGLLSNAVLAFCEPAGYHVPGYLIFSIAKLCVLQLLT